MPRIMIVDDDVMVIKFIKTVIDSEGEYTIDTFTDPVKAYSVSENQEYDMVIVDFKMPDMDGITFLKKFKLIQPNARRIMISTNVDRQALFCAINEAQPHKFLDKPIDASALQTLINEEMR